MYDDILAPIDESAGATVAFDHVLDIAAAYDATLHLLAVADTTRTSTTRIHGTVIDTLVREGERIVREAADRARQRDIATVTEVVQGVPDSTIISYADSFDIDLIAMPTRGNRGIERFLLGSTTERVLRRATVPVLAIPFEEDTSPEYPYQAVLVPTDGSDCADRALRVGTDVASSEGAAFHALTAIALPVLGVDTPDTRQMAALEQRATELVDEATAFAADSGIDSVTGTVERSSSIHQAILSYIDEHSIDLVVVGTHGRTGFERYVLGSVTEYLVRTSSIPLLIVRDFTDDE